jgi:TatA/E family protein of Tat protein translocase
MIANLFGPDLGIVVLVIIVVALFGSQLPKIARNVGMAGREFRKAQQEAEEEAERERATKAAAAAAPGASVVPPPAAVGPAPAPAPPLASTAAAAPAEESSVTLTASQLDALLRAREEQARREAAGPASN